jgi:hypothetical protein
MPLLGENEYEGNAMRKLIIIAIVAAAATLTLSPVDAQPAPPAPNPAWKQLDFLLGKWHGFAAEKDTPLGPGQGDFSFLPELNGKIIVRHNNATYASGVQHDDLLVIYLDPPDAALHSIYFDSEGHTIRYLLKFPAPNSVVFESDGTQPGPRYRLSYWLETSVLQGKFEVAPPGAEYKAYMTWGAKKN